MKHLLGTLLLVLVAMPAMAGTVYRWKDAGGVVHYSDARPPVGIKYEVQTHAGSSAAAEALPAEIPSENVSSRCQSSRQSVQALSTVGIPVMMDLDGDGKAEPLSPDAQQRQLELAKAQEKAFCSP